MLNNDHIDLTKPTTDHATPQRKSSGKGYLVSGQMMAAVSQMLRQEKPVHGRRRYPEKLVHMWQAVLLAEVSIMLDAGRLPYDPSVTAGEVQTVYERTTFNRDMLSEVAGLLNDRSRRLNTPFVLRQNKRLSILSDEYLKKQADLLRQREQEASQSKQPKIYTSEDFDQ